MVGGDNTPLAERLPGYRGVWGDAMTTTKTRASSAS